MIKSPKAACLGVTDIFYGPHVDLRQEPEEEKDIREEACRRICSRCEILWPCLRWALIEDEPWGVWGGMPYRERQKFRRFLRRRYGEIPDEETVQDELHRFLVEERKAKAREAKTKKKDRDGDRPVIAGNRGGRVARKKTPVQRKASNGAASRQRNTGKPSKRAAPKRKIQGD